MVVIGNPEQTDWLPGEANASAVGFTNTVAKAENQPSAEAVMLNVTVTGTR
jgi:hypothetical protein